MPEDCGAVKGLVYLRLRAALLLSRSGLLSLDVSFIDGHDDCQRLGSHSTPRLLVACLYWVTLGVSSCVDH